MTKEWEVLGEEATTDELKQEIKELHGLLKESEDKARETAKQAEKDLKKAEETVEYYKELHAERKKDCDCLEEQLSNLHEAHDRLREYIAASLKVV